MKTIIQFYDYEGKLTHSKESDYLLYMEGNLITFKNEICTVRGLTFEEEENIKYVRAYSPTKHNH